MFLHTGPALVWGTFSCGPWRMARLFVQGTRDKLGELLRMGSLESSLTDHGFDVLMKSGRTPAEVMT